MKFFRLSLLALFTLAAAAAVRAETFSYPAGGDPIFSVDVPNGWKPKANKKGRVEATSPDEDAYVELWVLKGKKADAIGDEIEEILESSVNNPKVEGEPKKASFGGLDGFLVEGSNNLGAAFKRIDEDNQFHYLMTYSPKNAAFDGKFRDTPTYKRSELLAGNVIAGPALVEEHASTTVVPPGDILTVDDFGNLIIDIARSCAWTPSSIRAANGEWMNNSTP